MASRPVRLRWIIAVVLAILVVASLVFWGIMDSQPHASDDETFEGFMTFETPEV